MRKTLISAGIGGLLAFGAPAGLVILRSALAGDFSLAFVVGEVSTQIPLYGYVLCSTTIAFACFGAFTGFQADALDRLARVDHLTGLLNRRALEPIIALECARARRQRSTLALLLIDVDGLKEINDLGGHWRGDQAIRAVAGAILRASRATDVCARWGGDEFAILACATEERHCQALAERIRQLVEAQSAGVTVSIGVATWLGRYEAVDPASLFVDADEALYRAKAEGRNRVVVRKASHAAGNDVSAS